MKLDAALLSLSIAVVSLAEGCGTRATNAPVHGSTPTPSAATRLMAAEVEARPIGRAASGEGVVRVGKAQRSRDEIGDAEVTTSRAPHRRSDRRGSGFSGYK